VKQLSIIIPHFNSVNLLKNLIKSIPINDEIEVIVIDDNSTKDLNELERLQLNPEFRHVTFLTNDTGIQSAGTCRNIGLDVAKGEWVLFADADDFFVEDFYQIVQKYFESNYDVVLFSPTSIYIDTNQLSTRHIQYENLIKNYMNKDSLKNEAKLRYEYVVPWSKLIKRSFIEENNIKFDEVIAMNDIMFSTKVGYYMGRYLVSSEVIYCATRNRGSLTMMMTKEVHDSRVDSLIKRFNFVNENVSKEQRKYLNISSANALFRTYKMGFGFSEILSTYQKFRKNNIKTFDRRFFNPLFIIRRTISDVLFNKKEKKYYKS